MPSPFDNLQTAMMDVVTSTMGYEASWQPVAGGPLKTGRVLLKSPTKKQEIQDADFFMTYWTAEYREGVFDGLKASVDNATNQEQITVNGSVFKVRQIKQVYDGKTYIALLDPTND